MPSLTVIVPGSLTTCTGGYIYDRRIVTGLRERGWQVTVQELPGSFPTPSPAARNEAARVLAAVPDAADVLVDGLALGALPSEAARERSRLRLTGLVHHPLALETGLDDHTAACLMASEREALSSVRQAIVTSHATAGALTKDYGVGADRIAVVAPGTDPAPLARGSTDHIVRIVCVAAIVPRKGHGLLIRALAGISHGGWRLRCIGSLERDRSAVADLHAQVAAEGFQDRVSLVGEMDQIQICEEYDAADLFVLPTLHEGYGMAVAEALARGLPVISTPTGAIADLVGTHAGVLVPAGDVESLRAALARLIDDESERRRFAEGAREVRQRLPTWGDAVTQMAAALA